jgi:Flp pilus assembly protein TadD
MIDYPMKRSSTIPLPWCCLAAAALALLVSACAFKPSGYGVGAQAERAAMSQNARQDPKPDTPGMYLALIDRMQAQGLYFASLAHIDAYEKQYGVTPDSTLLRADALRQTGQPEASASAYRALLATPLASRGYRGLGLVAGAAGDFGMAAHDLEEASALAPTDAATLSDLGYARLREGDVAGARVPLLKAAELDAHNTTVLANVALLLLSQGHVRDARALMDDQHFSSEVREAVRQDAAKVALAQRARRPVQSLKKSKQARPEETSDTTSVPSTTNASARTPLPLLQRFAQ